MPTPKTPLLATDCVVFDARGRVLLIRRGYPPFKGAYALPGGFVEIGETVEDACRRELMEETGVKAGRLELLGAYSDPRRDPRAHTCSVVFRDSREKRDRQGGRRCGDGRMGDAAAGLGAGVRSRHDTVRRQPPAAAGQTERDRTVGDFDGKVMLVTGGGTGLGAAIAVGAARRGAKAVIINYAKSAKEAEATAEEVRAAGAEAITVQGDVAEDADCIRIAKAAEKFGSIDALANNAGITKHMAHAKLDGLTKDDFLRLYAVNTVGPFQMVRACRPLLEKSSGLASVLMTSSIAGVRGIGSSVAYAASKGALNVMTMSLARALAPKIRVNAICPGFIDTRWFGDAFGAEQLAKIRENVAKSTPLQVASNAEDIAETALFLLSDAARRITGETLLTDAGLHLGPTIQRGPA